MTIRAVGKVIALLAVYGTVFAFAELIYVTYRYSNVRTIAVSKLSDLDDVFEVGTSSLKVKSPEFLKVCFAADYVYALKDAQKWFAPDDTEFAPALEAAGGPTDTLNREGSSSIVLLSHTSAVILQFGRGTEFAAVNLGCARTDAGDIQIRRYQTNSRTEFFLPNATLKSRGPEQSPTALCVEKLNRFVESIDELLAKNVTQDDLFWAAIRNYLPANGCSAKEVISISRKAKFSMEPFEQYVSYTIGFGNSYKRVWFRLEKDTGSISYPGVGSTGLPSW